MSEDQNKEEEVKQDVVEETTQTPPVESTSQDTQEQTTETPAPTEDKPEIDPEAIAEQATQRAEERLMGRFASALGLTKDEEAQAKDDGLVAPWEKEGRNPKSYKEVADYSADLAEWKRKQAETKAEEEKKAQAEQVEKEKKQWNDFWDGQISDLEAAGKLPKVEDKDNPDDPGKIARKALWTKMAEVNQERLAKGLQAITSIKEIYYEHYEDPNAQPDGYDAPVSMGKKAVATGPNGEFNYNDIHGKDIDQLIEGK